MSSFAPLSARGLYVLLVPFIGLVMLSLASLRYFRGPPAPCDAQSSQLSVVVYVNGALRDRVAIIKASEALRPLGVEPGETVTISAEIAPRPDGCSGAFSIDWELSFVVFSLLDLKTIAETPASEKIEITLGPRSAAASGEDHITLIVKDASGEESRAVILPLKETSP